MLDDAQAKEIAEAKKAAADMARVHLLGEMMSAATKQLRALDKPWLRLPEDAQKKVLRQVEQDCREGIERAVEIIASDARTQFRASVESVTFKDGVKAVITMGNTQASHELADVAGGSVLVVIEDPARYTGFASDAAPKPEPNQPALPVNA